ncbi:protein of unknown function [Ruminococcaceae bacterium BL-4]|nr:protein of unknown function [Ruminococcaceae bacterium BL-4]
MLKTFKNEEACLLILIRYVILINKTVGKEEEYGGSRQTSKGISFFLWIRRTRDGI